MNPVADLGANLRAMLQAPELSFLMEAHDGLSARIAAQAGFAALWASGLSISACFGLRDANEVSMTQLLDVLECMMDAAELPILVDGDSGYGDFNNVQQLVRKLCQRRIAGVCLEDKLFPKRNSFVGAQQELATIEEFQGKLRAAKDAQLNNSFCVVARCEALIAGRGMDEALTRCHYYAEAGADAVLIHSRASDADEILAFAQAWRQRLPLVIVPTMYWRTPSQVFAAAGISTVIWANHSMRAAVASMQQVCRQIQQERSVAGVEAGLAPVSEILRLTGMDELHAAEARYLPRARSA
jgi:phosphoenolpyruvate phosphomutase